MGLGREVDGTGVTRTSIRKGGRKTEVGVGDKPRVS